MSRRSSRAGFCVKCGTWRDQLQRDHIVPKHIARRLGWLKEQTDAPGNIQLLCANCHEDKTRVEVAAANAGRVVSAETRTKLSAVQLGLKHSEATRAKMRRPHRSPPPRTAEHRANIAASRRANGKTWTVASREKARASHLGVPYSFARRVRAFIKRQEQGDKLWLEM